MIHGDGVHLHKIRDVLVGHHTASWIECMLRGIAQQIGDITCVNVGESEQAPRKICWVVIGAENTAKLFIEHTFCGISEKINGITFETYSNPQ